jgi:hypothetical protein
LACPIGLEDVRKLGLVGTADLLARLGDVLLKAWTDVPFDASLRDPPILPRY